MKQYTISKKAVAVRIGRVLPKGRGATLVSVGVIPAVSIDVSPEFVARAKPKQGDYYVKYTNGYETTATPETFERDFKEDGVSTEQDNTALFSAKMAYRVFYSEQNGKYDNGHDLPTVDELFTEPEHADRAQGWIEAASEALGIPLPPQQEGEPSENPDGDEEE